MLDYHIVAKVVITSLLITGFCLVIKDDPAIPRPVFKSSTPIMTPAEPIPNDIKHVIEGSVWMFPISGSWVIEIENGITRFFLYQGKNSILNYQASSRPDHNIYVVHDVFLGKVYTGTPDECGLKLLMQPLVAEELAKYLLDPTPIDKKIATRIGDFHLRSDEDKLIITKEDIVYFQRKISDNEWELDWVEEGKKATIKVNSIKSVPISF